MLKTICLLFGTVLYGRAAVLDPALFLSPSPPLTDRSDGIPPGELWHTETRVTRDASTSGKKTSQSNENEETMENAETFWPSWRSATYGIRGIHIPLTFSVSGTYGHGGYGSGVIGSTYGSISSDAGPGKFGSYGKSGLAGSSYGSFGYPGVRIYGNTASTGWSGWGNGKWGHYGKG